MAGTGRMDFYIVAPVGNNLRKVAVEAKKAPCSFRPMQRRMREVAVGLG